MCTTPGSRTKLGPEEHDGDQTSQNCARGGAAGGDSEVGREGGRGGREGGTRLICFGYILIRRHPRACISFQITILTHLPSLPPSLPPTGISPP